MNWILVYVIGLLMGVGLGVGIERRQRKPRNWEPPFPLPRTPTHAMCCRSINEWEDESKSPQVLELLVLEDGSLQINNPTKLSLVVGEVARFTRQ